MMKQIGARIIIVGTTGSGKSTLARSLSGLLDKPHIELDALHWEENWTVAPEDIFFQKIKSALNEANRGWVVDGNYTCTRPITWTQADTVIWLSYPLRISMRRLARRTFSRFCKRTELWNGNRENLWSHLFKDKSLFRCAAKKHYRRSEMYTELMQSDKYPNINYIRFNHPEETENWLTSIGAER